MNGMEERVEELLNVYDDAGAVIGSQRRPDAKASGLVVGAVNILLVKADGEILLQRRPEDKENGGLWDKSVGGHVAAGESHDTTAVREAEEELFDSATTGRVHLVESQDALARAVAVLNLTSSVVFFRAALHLNLRDVRHAPGGGRRNVLYHLAVYLGRTDVPIERFRPQPSEVAELAYFKADEVDDMLLAGRLAPNMAFAWLAFGHPLLDLAGHPW
jgi:isopentenyldiphosphate isomerase